MNRQVREEETQIYENTKTSLLSTKIQMKAVKYHFYSPSEDVEKWECELFQPFSKAIWQYLKH